jgi:hypothetical protein
MGISCHNMLNPSWDASQRQNIKNLKYIYIYISLGPTSSPNKNSISFQIWTQIYTSKTSPFSVLKMKKKKTKFFI